MQKKHFQVILFTGLSFGILASTESAKSCSPAKNTSKTICTDFAKNDHLACMNTANDILSETPTHDNYQQRQYAIWLRSGGCDSFLKDKITECTKCQDE